MKKGLFRFCVAVLIVLASVAVVDVAVGKVMDWMLPQISNQGSTGKTYFSLYEVNTPIVIVGSSRASHHYVTQMIEDATGIPAWNVGRNGCYFSYNCCVINTIIERYSPKLIIWENDMNYLFEDSSDPLESLFPYYDKNEYITKVINENVPSTESFSLHSRLYQYNSTIQRIMIRYANRKNHSDERLKGFEPMPNKKHITPLVKDERNMSNKEVSEKKAERLRNTICRVKDKGIQLVIVDSPKYVKQSCENNSKATMISICNEYNIPIIDNTQLADIVAHPEFFYDRSHLNENGAKAYTKIFLEQLQSIGVTRFQ